MSSATTTSSRGGDEGGSAAHRASTWDPVAFKDLIDAAPDAILVVASDGTIELVNRQAEALFGWRRTDLVSRNVDSLVPAEVRAAHAHRRAAFGTAPSTRPMGASLDLSAVRADGTEVPVDISLSPLRLRDGRDVVVAAIRDVTSNRRDAEALREANASLVDAVADLEARSHAMTLLASGSEVLQGCHTIDEALELISRATPRIFGDLAGALLVRRSQHGAFEPHAAWFGFEATPIDPETCWAQRTGKPHLHGHDPIALRCAHVHPDVTWSMCIPLIAQGETIALVYVQDGSHPDPDGMYTSRQAELGRLLSTQWGLTLANMRLRETLRSESVRDPLTGLYNRRYLDEAFPQALSRAAREGGCIVAAMIDLDHFKVYNDSLGHTAGDELLRDLGRHLLESTRGHDIVARLGGDEFLVVLPDISVRDGNAKLASMVEAWRNRPCDVGTPPRLSVGVALYPDHAGTSEDLIKVADRALYRAKEAGRDRVVIGAPLRRVPAPVPQTG